MPVTHESLIVRIQEGGDAVDWEEFFEIYRPYVHSLVRRWGIPEDDACDLVQDVFVTLIRVLPRFEYSAKRGRFRGWLKTIVQNTVIDWLRRRGRRNEVAFNEQLTAANDPIVDQLEAAHRTTIFEFASRAVRDVSRPTTWACFEEHLLKGRRAGDVADELGMTANAVYVNAARTLGRIRKRCLGFDEDLASDGQESEELSTSHLIA